MNTRGKEKEARRKRSGVKRMKRENEKRQGSTRKAKEKAEGSDERSKARWPVIMIKNIGKAPSCNLVHVHARQMMTRNKVLNCRREETRCAKTQ